LAARAAEEAAKAAAAPVAEASEADGIRQITFGTAEQATPTK